MLAVAADRLNQSKVDRWFFSGMASLCLLIAIVGFAPNSVAIVVGELPSPPLIVHLHATLMVAWLVLLICQSILIGNESYRFHQRLGSASVVLVPLMLLVMATLVLRTFNPDLHPYSIGLIQARRLILFPAFWSAAMLTRRSNRAAHKRLQIWGTLVLLDAAILRMTWLPSFGIENTIAVSGTYLLLAGTPMVLYDLYANGRLHKANATAAILVAGTSVAASLLW